MSEKRTDPNSMAAVFGKKLASLRKDRQMTQLELAEALDMTRSMICYYESWARNPTIEAVKKVADYFEVPFEDLIAESKEKSKKRSGPTSRLEQLFLQAKKQSPFKQKIIANVLEAALKT